MELDDVLVLCRIFEAAKLPFWVDGGWGVDALVKEQTRPHSDLDLAVCLSDLPEFERVLEKEGYARTELNGEPDWNWVLRNPKGLSVDLHGFVWDDQRNGILGDPANGEMYPSKHLMAGEDWAIWTCSVSPLRSLSCSGTDSRRAR